jgi:hypothetical protein
VDRTAAAGATAAGVEIAAAGVEIAAAGAVAAIDAVDLRDVDLPHVIYRKDRLPDRFQTCREFTGQFGIT